MLISWIIDLKGEKMDATNLNDIINQHLSTELGNLPDRQARMLLPQGVDPYKNITEILNSICNLVIDFLSRMNDESSKIINRYGSYNQQQIQINISSAFSTRD